MKSRLHVMDKVISSEKIKFFILSYFRSLDLVHKVDKFVMQEDLCVILFSRLSFSVLVRTNFRSVSCGTEKDNIILGIVRSVLYC